MARMEKNGILSVLSRWQDTGLEAPHAAASAHREGWGWSGCQLAVVVRAVLFVQALAAAGALLVVSQPRPDLVAWVLTLSVWTVATLPGTLVWLLLACSARRLLWHLHWPLQWAALALFGALGGVAGAAMLWLTGTAVPPWLGSALAGGLLAACLSVALRWRARARTPAGVQARLAELQARIRPHFLFNTLNSAIALVRAEPAMAESLLEDLSELFRHALSESGDAVQLHQEVALAQRYLAIEQVRFGDRLRVTWDVDPQAHPVRLPPLILQPLVENAIRHGVEPSMGGADVHIGARVRGGKVVLKVSNSTPGGRGQAGQGLALRNVSERLVLLHDVEASFRAGPVPGGFLVRIEVPLP